MNRFTLDLFLDHLNSLDLKTSDSLVDIIEFVNLLMEAKFVKNSSSGMIMVVKEIPNNLSIEELQSLANSRNRMSNLQSFSIKLGLAVILTILTIWLFN
jgi:hypothetical protein